MLNKVRVVTDGDYRDINTTTMKEYVRQRSNSRWLSTAKVPLGVYLLAGRDSNWVNKVIKMIGEAPVVYDSTLAKLSCEDLKQALVNKGYLDAEVELYLDIKKSKVNAIYVLHPAIPYKINSFQTDIQDSVIADMLMNRGISLHEGMQFSADALNGERSGITSWLQDRGYFRFNKEFINYRARKNAEEHSVDLLMTLHPYRRHAEDSASLHSRYHVMDVEFINMSTADSTMHLRRHVLEENTFIEKGKPYSASALQNTYNHFGRLGAVKYTNISFEQAPDTTLLDAKIQIQSNKPSTISFQPEGTNTAGDLGAAASLTYQNRNS